MNNSSAISRREFQKTKGSHYTPKILSDFVASKIVENLHINDRTRSFRILDPAVGDGELLRSLVTRLESAGLRDLSVFGYDTDNEAINIARKRLNFEFPNLLSTITLTDFTEVAFTHKSDLLNFDLFPIEKFDLVIANPPYVRTQVLGSSKSKRLASDFGLSGRVDLYHVFIRGISSVLELGGVAGIIVSNRFMTTKSGLDVRKLIDEEFEIIHIWDLGDTKLFEASVLPAVLILRKKKYSSPQTHSLFTSIYSTHDRDPNKRVGNVLDALSYEGVVSVGNDQFFEVKKGYLKIASALEPWCITTKGSKRWLDKVEANTYCTFKDIGKVRVGVKSTADKIFIRSDWNELEYCGRPELLKPLTTHHVSRRFNAKTIDREILYTHEVVNGRRTAVQLENYPNALRYLGFHRDKLEARKYVWASGRRWFELWVPQDPESWAEAKLVFRDICEKPTFWMDLSGSIVNGDCYWMKNDQSANTDLLWLCLAVANSTFIERFYDYRFNNKLYSNRRRFMSQYVEKFPVPDPELSASKQLVDTSKLIFTKLSNSKDVHNEERELNNLVWDVFGLTFEEA